MGLESAAGFEPATDVGDVVDMPTARLLLTLLIFDVRDEDDALLERELSNFDDGGDVTGVTCLDLKQTPPNVDKCSLVCLSDTI